MKRAGQWLAGAIAVLAIAAPWLAPNAPDQRFPDRLYAPPTSVRLVHAATSSATSGSSFLAPFIYPQRLVSRLERRFDLDRSRPVSLRWFTDRHFVTVRASEGGPLLLLGADGFGRDIFSRMLYGARTSLALAIASTLGALFIGALIGGMAGYAGGVLDDLLSHLTDFVVVLPSMYVALGLRAVMPLVLAPASVFLLLTAIFALLGWPIVARGVRGIVAAERERDYVLAGIAAGSTSRRLLLRHLLPAARGYIVTQGTLLLPAFVLAEATLSFVGLGFPATVPTWGTLLQEAANVSLVSEAPWMLAPAGAIFAVVLAVNLWLQETGVRASTF